MSNQQEFNELIKSGRLAEIKELLNKNSTIDIRASVSHTCTHRSAMLANTDFAIRFAAQNGYLEMVKYLVSQGANIRAQDDAVKSAVAGGHLGVVKYLVSQRANIKAKNDNALIEAARYVRLDVVKYLVSQGANIRAQNNETLRLAILNCHINMVDYLLQKGAQYDINKLTKKQKKLLNKL